MQLCGIASLFYLKIRNLGLLFVKVLFIKYLFCRCEQFFVQLGFLVFDMEQILKAIFYHFCFDFLQIEVSKIMFANS